MGRFFLFAAALGLLWYVYIDATGSGSVRLSGPGASKSAISGFSAAPAKIGGAAVRAGGN